MVVDEDEMTTAFLPSDQTQVTQVILRERDVLPVHLFTMECVATGKACSSRAQRELEQRRRGGAQPVSSQCSRLYRVLDTLREEKNRHFSNYTV